MKVNEILVEGLTDSVAKALAKKANDFVEKVKKLEGVSGFYKVANKHSKEILEIFKSAKNAAGLKSSLREFAKKLAKTETVKESQLSEGFAKMAIAGLSGLASVADVILAKMLGIYNQMGQPDIVSTSHLNVAGGILFGILPAMMCAMVAVLLIIEIKSED